MEVINAASMMYKNQSLPQLKIHEKLVQRDLKFYVNLAEKLKSCRNMGCLKNIVYPDDCGRNIALAQSKLEIIQKEIQARV